jgi:hypothetical protein
MDQEPNEPSKHLEDPQPKFRFAFPAITNLLIIGLFFCTFCQIKSCSGAYKPVSGMQLVQRTVQGVIRKPGPGMILSPIIIALGSAIVGLSFCFGDPQKLEKRTSISGMVGGLSILAFIGFCLLMEIKLALAPLLVATLHFANPLAKYFRNKPKPPSPD